MPEETVKEEKQKPETKKKNHSVLYLTIAILLILGFFTVKGDFNSIYDYFNPPTTEELLPADVELCRFVELHTNVSLSAEVWVINLGDETARNINVFVRARNQTGVVLFEGNISMTTVLLRGNESCSGALFLSFTNETAKIYHTIEVSWTGGRHSYQRETII